MPASSKPSAAKMDRLGQTDYPVPSYPIPVIATPITSKVVRAACCFPVSSPQSSTIAAAMPS